MPGLVAWTARNSTGLYLSVATVAEVEDGTARSRRQRAWRKADRLAGWLETLLHLHGSRILPVDLPAARRLGRLTDRARRQEQAPGLADLIVAATAQLRGYTILTGNLQHFALQIVPVPDPLQRGAPKQEPMTLRTPVSGAGSPLPGHHSGCVPSRLTRT